MKLIIEGRVNKKEWANVALYYSMREGIKNTSLLISSIIDDLYNSLLSSGDIRDPVSEEEADDCLEKIGIKNRSEIRKKRVKKLFDIPKIDKMRSFSKDTPSINMGTLEFPSDEDIIKRRRELMKDREEE